MKIREAAVAYRAFVESDESKEQDGWRSGIGPTSARLPAASKGRRETGFDVLDQPGRRVAAGVREDAAGPGVSNTVQNGILDSVVVVPLSANPGEIWPLRLELHGPKGKPSFAVLPGIRQVSKVRLMDFIGLVAPDVMRRVDEALVLYLSD